MVNLMMKGCVFSLRFKTNFILLNDYQYNCTSIQLLLFIPKSFLSCLSDVGILGSGATCKCLKLTGFEITIRDS